MSRENFRIMTRWDFCVGIQQWEIDFGNLDFEKSSCSAKLGDQTR